MLTSILFLATISFVQLPSIQKRIADEISQWLSSTFDMNVVSEKVHVSLLSGVMFEDLLVVNEYSDTLVCIKKLKLKPTHFNLRNLEKVYIEGMYLNGLLNDSTQKDYLSQLLDSLILTKTTITTKPELNIDIKSLWINNGKIDYGNPDNHIQIRYLNLFAKDMRLGDDLKFDISQMSWEMNEGVSHKFSADFNFSDKEQHITNFNWRSDNSYLKYSYHRDIPKDRVTIDDFELVADASSSKSIYKDFPDSLLIEIKNDLFIDSGTLVTNNLILKSNNKSLISGNLIVNDVYDMSDMTYRFEMTECTVNKDEWDWLEPLFDKNYLLSKLGSIEAKGMISGSPNDVDLKFDLDSDVGAMSADIFVGLSDTVSLPIYDGRLNFNEFNLQPFSRQGNLGKINAKLDVQGEGFDIASFNTIVSGYIAGLTWNNYNYQNINLNGRLKPNHFSGETTIADDNLELDFSGEIDFSGSKPKLDFVADIIETDLVALNLYKNSDKALFSSLIEINLVGSSWEDIEGDLDVFFTNLETEDYYYHIDDIYFKSIRSNVSDSLIIKSQFADVNLSGDINIPEIFNSFNSSFKPHLPLLPNGNTYRQDFNFKAKLYNTKTLTNLFLPSLRIADGTVLEGEFDSYNNNFSAKINSPEVIWNNLVIEHLDISTLANRENWLLDLKTSTVSQTGNNLFENIELENKGSYGDWRYSILWASGDTLKYDGYIKGNYNVSPKKLSMAFDESQLYFADTLWQLNNTSQFSYSNGNIVSNINLFNPSQKLDLTINNDQIELSFNNFETYNFYPWMVDAKTYLDGRLDGKMLMNSENELYGNLTIDSTLLNDYYFGDINANIYFDPQTKRQLIAGSVNANGEKEIDFNGSYLSQLDSNNFNLNIDVGYLDLAHIESYVDDIFEEFSGSITGKFDIYGAIDDAKFDAKFDVNKMIIDIPLLNTRMESYNTSKMNITEKYIDFDGVLFSDNYAGNALLTGELLHNNFTDFSLGLQLDVDSFLCLNTDAFNEERYYGKVISTGDVTFKGPLDAIAININAKTEKGTDIFIPLDDDDAADDLSFIHFIDDKNIDLDSMWSAPLLSSNSDPLNIDFNLEFNDKSHLNLIFDEELGDKIRAKGNGFIKIGVNGSNDINMFGEYIVDEGEYLFTLQNFANKKFEIEQGATFVWDGDPYEAQMDLRALYKLNTNISPLSSEYNRNADVECRMIMTGQLLQPKIEFDVQIPKGDDLIKRILEERTNTEEKNTQQFLSLLVLNSFMSSDEFESTDVDYLSSTVSNGVEVLNNQLSNWTSQFTDRVDLGIKYRPSLGDTLSNKEFELLLNNMKLNDRITLNGNIGTLPSQNTTRVIGDLKVEYRLSDDGKLKLVAFRNLEESFEIQVDETNYTTGVGLFYRDEFEDFSNLWDRVIHLFKSKKNKL